MKKQKLQKKPIEISWDKLPRKRKKFIKKLFKYIASNRYIMHPATIKQLIVGYKYLCIGNIKNET